MSHYYRSNINRACNKCNLSTGKAVDGQSEVPFNQVKLIVISSYPGNAEEQLNLSLAPPTKRKGRNKQTPAGEFIRKCFKYIFDNCDEIPDIYKPFEKYIYFTNSIKCKKTNQNILSTHRQICKSQWLQKELTIFNLQNPKVPILLAGSDPVKAILGEKESVYGNRNKELYYAQHPITVCENPINIEKGMIRQLVKDYNSVYEEVKVVLKSRLHAKKKEALLDQIIETAPYNMSYGMSNYFFKEDLENLKHKVIKYINDSI